MPCVGDQIIVTWQFYTLYFACSFRVGGEVSNEAKQTHIGVMSPSSSVLVPDQSFLKDCINFKVNRSRI